jgi:selenocysteine lyase/cysteine desulfurase
VGGDASVIGVFSRFVDPSGLRAEFPVLSRLAYLNAGTDGPLPARAVRAAEEELRREAQEGRWQAHFERRAELSGELRGAYASVLGCDPGELALTTCTTEGIAQVIGGLDLGRGDEILTSDEEHPGLLGALTAARELRGVSIRAVPLPEIAAGVDPRTTSLVACSHVGWMSGRLAPVELAELDVPVLLDGAQGAGAIPVDVRALGCDAYAGAGQKWLCGPDGTGMLYVSPGLHARLNVARRGYPNLADPQAGLSAILHEDARRYDSPSLSAETLACALASVSVLESAGRRALHERGDDARVVPQPGPASRARTTVGARRDAAKRAGKTVAACVGGRVERRGRPAKAALGAPSVNTQARTHASV